MLARHIREANITEQQYHSEESNITCREANTTEKGTCISKCLFPGAPWGIRTLDLLLRRQLLYPTELRVLMFTCGIISYIDGFVKPDRGVFIKNGIKNIEIY